MEVDLVREDGSPRQITAAFGEETHEEIHERAGVYELLHVSPVSKREEAERGHRAEDMPGVSFTHFPRQRDDGTINKLSGHEAQLTYA